MRYPSIDTGDTAWMLMATALVMLMTIPGLALFYAGMVRKKNVLSTLKQSFAICCLISILWMSFGYSLALTTGTSWIGDFSRLFLNGLAQHFHHGADNGFILGAGSQNPTLMNIPESVYMLFQMSFAIIAPALITGAYAERMKFKTMCVFSLLWSCFVYIPIAHWVWSPLGWLGKLGAIDFAGGTVVHVNAGISGLVCALMLGKRRGLKKDKIVPFNLAYAITGACLLWVGWFGFNAGSAFGANGRAAMAMVVTQIAAASAGTTWMLLEWLREGRSTLLGIISGSIGGLVAITPASGVVLPQAALFIGIVAGFVSYLGAVIIKPYLGYDDSLDAFGVHGLSGIVGSLLTGLLAYGPLSATDTNPKGISGSWSLFFVQFETIIVVVLWCSLMSCVILKILDLTMGLRISKEEEDEGLDRSQHNEYINI